MTQAASVAPAALPNTQARWAWIPSAEHLSRSRLLNFARHMGCASRVELGELAAADPDTFWAAAWDWLELPWQSPPQAMRGESATVEHLQWFPGGEFNIADACIDRWLRAGAGERTALLGEDENGPTAELTFAELDAEVQRVARGLRDLGLCTGDRVAIQLPSTTESAVAALACARLGLIVVPIFSGFGVDAIAERVNGAQVSAYITTNTMTRRGRAIDLRDLCRSLQGKAPSVHTFVMVGASGEGAAPLRNETRWDSLGRSGPSTPIPPVPLPADHPLMIAFTSGTTGAPKGTTLSHAGFALKAGTDAAWCFDISPGDTVSWMSDPGWVMSPITLYGGLLLGATVALFDGVPTYPDTDRMWSFVRSAGVSILGLSPTLVRSLLAEQNSGQGTGELGIDTGPLRLLASSGEPWSPEAFAWLNDTVCAGRLPIINYSGGTEVSGAILSNYSCEPIRACGFAGPVPGMGAAIVDDTGSEVRQGQGELILRSASPGMTLEFWQNPVGRHETYWSTWPDIWRHGDTAEIDADGVWYIRGRSDDTLNVAGKRVGPAEFESVVNADDRITESVAIGVPDEIKGQSVVIFAQRSPAAGTLSDADAAALAGELRTVVGEHLGKALLPKRVHLVTDLPRTRSGKLMRKLTRAVYLDPAHPSPSSVENPAALETIRSLR